MSAIDFAALMKAEKQRRRAAAAGPATTNHAADGGDGGAAAGAGGGTVAPAPSAASPPTSVSGHAVVPPPDDVALRFPRVHLSDYRVGDVPTAYYVPDFVTEADATALTTAAHHAHFDAAWVQLRSRKVQMWGGTATPQGLMGAGRLPQWVAAVCEAMKGAGVFPDGVTPNHVLLNEYAVDEGILPHTDGPCYHPHVAILSLGETAVFEFVTPAAANSSPAAGTPSTRTVQRLVVRPRSLLAFSDALYHEYLHTVSADTSFTVDASVVNAAAAGVTVGDVLERRRPRLSMTVRKVPLPTEVSAAAYGGDVVAPS